MNVSNAREVCDQLHERAVGSCEGELVVSTDRTSVRGRDPDGNWFEIVQVNKANHPACSVQPGRVFISVVDLERSISFYRDLLRMQLIGHGDSPSEGPHEGPFPHAGVDAKWAVLSAPGMELELIELTSPPPRQVGEPRPVCDYGISHFCIEVEGIEREYARLLSGGVEFHCPPLDFFGKATATYGRDPDGNVFEMLQLKGA